MSPRDHTAEIRRREIQACAACDRGLMTDGRVCFVRIRLERFAFEAGAIVRRHGLELTLGGGFAGAALAEVMGPDEALATRLVGPFEVLLCESCLLGREAPDPMPGSILPRGVCRICGCTDNNGCPGGCAWVGICRTLYTPCTVNLMALLEKLQHRADLEAKEAQPS